MFRNRPILIYALRLSLIASVVFLVFLSAVVATRWVLHLGQNGSSGPSTTDSTQSLAAIFTPEVLHWSPLINAWALAYNVDPNLIATVIQIESCGDPNVV